MNYVKPKEKRLFRVVSPPKKTKLIDLLRSYVLCWKNPSVLVDLRKNHTLQLGTSIFAHSLVHDEQSTNVPVDRQRITNLTPVIHSTNERIFTLSLFNDHSFTLAEFSRNLEKLGL